MNMLSVSAAAAMNIGAYLIAWLFVLRLLAVKFASHPWAQGLAAIVH